MSKHIGCICDELSNKGWQETIKISIKGVPSTQNIVRSLIMM